MQSILLKAIDQIEKVTSNHESNSSSSFTYIAVGVTAALGIAYLLMNSNSQAPTGGAAAAASASSAPVRQREGEPDPERVFTLEQLKAYDGSNPTGPIYVGCMGKVFDVTSGAGFYGPGGSYNVFAGKDASRGLAKMDLKFSEYGIDDLSASEKQTLKEWHDKFDSKYPVVGKIVDYSQANSGPKKE